MINSFTEDEAALLPGDPMPVNVVPFTEINKSTLNASQRAEIKRIAEEGRDATIKAIREALKRRSGKTWSVTGGRGTAHGWIAIDAPPARRTGRKRVKPGAEDAWPPQYETVDTGKPGGNMTAADVEELSTLMGLDRVHHQGHSIPAQTDFYRVAICRAMHGHDGGFMAEAQWD